jgi:molybdate transport system substrate-binding protein
VVIRILSAGSIEPGLAAAVEAFQCASGSEAAITWATTPAIRKRLAEGGTADIVIVPPALVDDLKQAGKVSGRECVHVGRVGVGVVVRDGAPLPDIASVGALKLAVLNASSVVFNRASSGLYVEGLLASMGLLDQVRAKTVRFDNGPAMMAHLIKGKRGEIGFGAVVEILLFRGEGLKLVGPLPAEVQHYTAYMATPMLAASNADGARAFMQFLATPAAKALFASHGID